jgi:hypothetical protein
VLLRLSLTPDDTPTYAALAAELALTASEIHAGLERAALARLARKDSAGKPAVVVREALRCRARIMRLRRCAGRRHAACRPATPRHR